jgi:hypothetical protein
MRRNEDFMLETNDAWIGETDDVLSWETKEFRKGYQNAIMQFQKKYNCGRKEASTEPQQANPIVIGLIVKCEHKSIPLDSL